MLTYFPRYFSVRAIICYVVTLALVSTVFINYAMPFQFVLFGFVPVCIFFVYSNQLTMNWQIVSARFFKKKIFTVALIIRIICVVFLYFYFLQNTGRPHAYAAADELQYHYAAGVWRLEGFDRFWKNLITYYSLDDRGYITWLGLEYLLFGTHVLPARILKCFIDAFSCVLVYNLAKRNFGEAVGRMAAVFYMLMPNMWYYCGITLKETEMSFLVILFLERADLALRAEKLSLPNILLPSVIIIVMFTFRTALAAVMAAALGGALIMSPDRHLKTWNKILYSVVFAVWMFFTVGVEIKEETQRLWDDRETNQTDGYVWRAQQVNGNVYAQYATASVFAPFIFTIPFSSMVSIGNQENLMMMNGAYFIKNVLSGLTIFALVTLIIRRDWRKHFLLIALTCGYLIVLVFSNFAHSERFHFPVLAIELLFAAYGVSLMKNKHKRWFVIWLVLMCVANLAWAWIKLSGRGMV